MKKITILIVIVLALTAVVGSGALSAAFLYNRSVSASVLADNSNPYLQFLPTGTNNVYHGVDAAGRMKIHFGASGIGGMGINPDSENYFSQVFWIRNQGTETLGISYTSDNPRCKLFWDHDYDLPVAGWVTAVQPIVLAPGSGHTLGVYIDARGVAAPNTINCNLTFSAD